MKNEREVINELVDLVVESFSQSQGANSVMLRPALNVVKMKLSKMDENDCAEIIDKVHFISHHIEKETGKLSPYHGIEPHPETLQA